MVFKKNGQLLGSAYGRSKVTTAPVSRISAGSVHFFGSES